MKCQNAEIPLKEIINVFKQINVKNILSIAKDIQKRLITDESLILNGNNEYKLVTQADIKIQKLLLDYFDNSSLKGTYQIITEEVASNKINKKNTSWKLLIDPLDGTSSFKNQKKTWGIMIGACDMNGVLRYSYNVVSTGEIYKTENNKKLTLKSFKQLTKTGKKILVDIYDYSSGTSARFDSVFEQQFSIGPSQYDKTSYPAAIWAGWQLYNQKLNGLLWLPSDQGKKYYPDYDLIFLGALFNKGYNIIIGKKDNNNSMIAIGLTLKDAEKLYEIGLSLLPKNQRQKMKKIVNKLKIIN